MAFDEPRGGRRGHGAARLAAAGCLAALLGAAPALAHDAGHGGHAAAAGPADAAGDELVELVLHDLALTDQHGGTARFKTGIVQDRIVVLTVLYTSCTTVCPVTSSILALVQDALGDRLGREVLLVSLTVDPVTDTPERLRQYAEKVGAESGWLWLTGAKPDVDRVLTGLDAYTSDYTQHPSVILVGDGRTNRWSRFYGFPSPDQILSRVEELLDDRQTDPSS